MLLEYRKVYLARKSDAESGFLAIAPRMVHGEEPMVQYLTDSTAPGSNAHSILHPSFARDEDGSTSVTNTMADDEVWVFEELTYDLWLQHIAPVIGEADRQYIERARAAGVDVQQYYLDQRLDEEAWPEFL